MLGDAHVEATVPAENLTRARRFYEGALGLRPSEAETADVDVLYECAGGTRLLVYEQQSPVYRAHTVAHFVVGDVEAAVRELRSRGVVFQDNDLPELQMVEGIATVRGHKFAWFNDPDGNVLGIHD
jgi:catechol 2,3-dioxygenase-like lactoylglutathione lyase family enzyme